MTGWLTGELADAPGWGPPADPIVGTLVHRLFQFAARANLDRHDDEGWLSHTRELLRPDERALLADPDGVVQAGLNAWRRMCERPEVAGVLASGELHHEVPFSLTIPESDPPVVLRGTIDCLVHRPDGSVVVVEFKTGRARPSHQQQLEIYVRAVQACYPAARVERLLAYL